ncbi:DUF4199 domain-containing protein [Brumimicrobium sp.]|uniref:DUF4199 domain-containing protein n=1 Tax=Brumimicrobium sp. TaxID=2029867 RepID=UPI003A8E259A
MEKVKVEIKWAMIFLLASLLWMYIEKLSGLHSTHIDQHLYWTNLFAIIAITVYVFALRDKKKSDYNGQMTYLQGLKSGVIISIIVAIFSPLTQWITATIITPEYFPNIIEYSVEQGYYGSVEDAQAYFNLESYMVQSAVGALMMGIVTSAIVAVFVRSKSKG